MEWTTVIKGKIEWHGYRERAGVTKESGPVLGPSPTMLRDTIFPGLSIPLHIPTAEGVKIAPPCQLLQALPFRDCYRWRGFWQTPALPRSILY